MFQLFILGGLTLIPPSSTRSQGNILINNSSSNNIYPMECEPSVISISSSSNQQPSLQIAPSLNQQQQQRYLQHLHSSRNSRLMSATLGNSYVAQKYAPASLPIDLLTAVAAGANGNVSNSSSIMVMPSSSSSTTTSQDHHHLNSSTSLIIHPGSVYAPFNDGTSIHHQNLQKVVGSGSSRNHNSNTNNNNTTNDESMVGVCVQQSPVVIH